LRHSNAHAIFDHVIPFPKADQRDLMTQWNSLRRSYDYSAVAVHIDRLALTRRDILNGNRYMIAFIMNEELGSGLWCPDVLL